jgi:hypothetical protein
MPTEILALLNNWASAPLARPCAAGCGGFVLRGTPGEPCANCQEQMEIEAFIMAEAEADAYRLDEWIDTGGWCGRRMTGGGVYHD